MTKGRVVCLVCLSVLIVAAAVSGAGAQAGSIAVFGDENLVSCNIGDNPGLVKLYVGHVYMSGARGARFVVGLPSTLVFLQETSPFAWTGDSASGITICYGACLSGSQLILEINTFGAGVTFPCSYINVMPDPAEPSGSVVALDCDWNVTFPTSGPAVVNPTPGCSCTLCLSCTTEIAETSPGVSHFCSWVPVEQTTWGKIKSMYE